MEHSEQGGHGEAHQGIEEVLAGALPDALDRDRNRDERQAGGEDEVEDRSGQGWSAIMARISAGSSRSRPSPSTQTTSTAASTSSSLAGLRTARWSNSSR